MLKVISTQIKHDYSCVMINFPDTLAKKIKLWCKKNVENISEEGHENKIHCTVKYGLHTNDSKKIQEVLKKFGKFTISLGSISRFISSDDSDVVKIEVEGIKLRKLHKLFNNLPNSDQFDEYKPHATMSYIDKGSNYKLSGDNTFKGEKFEVESVVFSPSIGDKINLEL